jgi:hypothetical protein
LNHFSVENESRVEHSIDLELKIEPISQAINQYNLDDFTLEKKTESASLLGNLPPPQNKNLATFTT